MAGLRATYRAAYAAARAAQQGELADAQYCPECGVKRGTTHTPDCALIARWREELAAIPKPPLELADAELGKRRCLACGQYLGENLRHLL